MNNPQSEIEQLKKRIKDIENEIDFIRTDRFYFKKTLDVSDGRSISTGGLKGLKIGTSTKQKIGFYNATPIIQSSGTAEAAVATDGSALNSYGYKQSQADNIVTLLNEIRSVLVNLGLMKGSA